MNTYGPMGVPYPSKEEIEAGKFDYLLKGGCQKVWLNRFCLKIENGKLAPTKELEEIWSSCNKILARNKPQSPTQKFWGSKTRC